ncbi:hypothetical protein L198_02904 [Cryptococcus wingfieldii CBS 7118]|uniref:Uncharacterized protein n=1 Tax=Cryptococcus wingfieldii CBS 7118 TaxID=1295528 RepID=A0A1E3JI73_9TREE|nr:hypothetical protein L198_02904 [Cryptococcus wingfieldii CBS 7118]ODO00584.1 hypothetical protein L198_02904 [Cryptococcus wingfieldii CBS 7118]
MITVAHDRTWSELAPSQGRTHPSNSLTILRDNDILFKDGNLSPLPDSTVFIVSNIDFDADKKNLSRKTIVFPRYVEGATIDDYSKSAATASRMNKDIFEGLERTEDDWLHEAFTNKDPEVLARQEKDLLSPLLDTHDDYKSVQILSVGENDFKLAESSIYDDMGP